MSGRDSATLHASWVDKGVNFEMSSEERLTLARALMQEPSFQDSKHRWNATVKADIKALYDSAVPNQVGEEIIHVDGKCVVIGGKA